MNPSLNGRHKMTIIEAQANHERLLREFDRTHPEENTNAYRKQRDKFLAKPSALIFRAIRAAQPTPDNDFQI
jgi:hypothetical protein